MVQEVKKKKKEKREWKKGYVKQVSLLFTKGWKTEKARNEKKERKKERKWYVMVSQEFTTHI